MLHVESRPSRPKDQDTKHALMQMEAAWRTLRQSAKLLDRKQQAGPSLPSVSLSLELRSEQTKFEIHRPAPNLPGATSAKPIGLYHHHTF
jgi:hypothetical protein